LFAADFPNRTDREWAWTPRGEASRYWEAEIGRRRLLYPVEAMNLNPTPHDGVWQNGVLRDSGSAAETTLVMASCDPAAGLLAAEYARASGFRLLVFPRGGRAALELLRQRLVHVAGLHYSTDEAPERNAETVRTQVSDDCQLLRVAKWESGIALATDDRSRSAESVARRLATLGGARNRLGGARMFGWTAWTTTFRRSRSERPRSGGRGGARRLGGGGRVRAVQRGRGGLEFPAGAFGDLGFVFSGSISNDPRIQALVRLLRGRTCRTALSANCPATTHGKRENFWPYDYYKPPLHHWKSG
jgi:hypothetical protein